MILPKGYQTAERKNPTACTVSIFFSLRRLAHLFDRKLLTTSCVFFPAGGFRRDDSSIDSLERELLDPPRKDKMSLSRDSGLTMSDSQLYTPDEEESTSSSSSGSGRGVYSSATQIHGSNYHHHNKVRFLFFGALLSCVRNESLILIFSFFRLLPRIQYLDQIPRLIWARRR